MKPLLEVKGLSKSYVLHRGWWGRGRQELKAVDDVSFSIRPGEQLGLVGESGCGKSSVGELLVRLIEPDRGTILYRGEDLTALGQRALKPFRKEMQIVFQDPFASLNPRLTIGETLEEPIIVHGIAGSAAERRNKVRELLELVGLPGSATAQYPHEFSGGQRQRISIARALATGPKFIVADEAVSSLDVSIQAQVLSLIRSLQRDLGLSMLFISHDLGAVRYISDRIAVMYLGRIVEIAPADELFKQPAHPYTRTLMTSIPSLRAARRSTRDITTGEMPSPLNPPSGCHFRTRCP
ncbi:MAG: ATP-binding cassette domain-containing protein, partial [Rhodospirillaceae bacterium]|nr:ATP-binding cassette domain-containing protein [Rhodospirillaceae bacterium]